MSKAESHSSCFSLLMLFPKATLQISEPLLLRKGTFKGSP